MQVYRDLPIITAIPDEEERSGIDHLGYGIRRLLLGGALARSHPRLC